MRIAVVTPEYPPDVIGGGGIVVQSLVHEYVKRHEVRVFSGWDSRRSWLAKPVEDVDDGVLISRYPLLPLSRQPYLRSVLPPNPVGVRRLWKDLRAWSPTVAHLHGYGYAIVDLAALALRRGMVPYVFTIHGIPLTPQQKGRIVRQAYSAYLHIGVGRTSRFARSITAISGAVAKALPGAEEVEVIPNGLTPLPTSDDIGAQRLRSRLNIAAGVPIIACAGRLTRAKGFDTLIKSLNYVDLAEAACVVAGTDGGMLPELVRLQAGVRPGVTVHFIGRQDRQGLADLFHLASVVAVPSRDEPFGLVALEAIGAGRRVVASNIGGLPEFLSPPLAQLVPEGDPVALAGALVLAIRRGALTGPEVAAAHNVVSRYSWIGLAPRYEALLALPSRPDARNRIQKESV